MLLQISNQAAADVVKTDALPADSELSSLCDVSWPPISKGDLEAKRMPLCDLAGGAFVHTLFYILDCVVKCAVQGSYSPPTLHARET